jgi:hypothetical protein
MKKFTSIIRASFAVIFLLLAAATVSKANPITVTNTTIADMRILSLNPTAAGDTNFSSQHQPGQHQQLGGGDECHADCANADLV